MVPVPYSQGRSIRYSDKLHDISVTIPRCYKDVYGNNCFPCTARLWNSLFIECFPLTYSLNGFKSRINRVKRSALMITVKLSSIFSVFIALQCLKNWNFNEWNKFYKQEFVLTQVVVFVLTQVVFNECSATKAGSLYFSLYIF